jgi:hypothetical protein
MQSSETIKEVSAALVRAQAEMKPAIKDMVNPVFRSKYADLSALLDVCMDPLSKHGIALLQSLTSTMEGVTVFTRLVHVSGEWLESDPLFIPCEKKTAHGFGSAATYAKRFSLQGFIAISTELDDDGEAASGQEIKNKDRKKREVRPQDIPRVVEKESPSDSKRPVELVVSGKPRQTASAIYCPLNNNKIQPKKDCAECDGKGECLAQ